MHNNIALIFLSYLLSTSALAQPVLTIEAEPMVYSIWQYNGWTPNTFFDPGSAGENQTWTFNLSGLGISTVINRDFLPSAGTQFGNQYPNASYCMRTSAGFGPPSYTYYSSTDSTVMGWGLAVPGGTRINYVQPFLKRFPLEFDSSYSGVFTGTRLFNNNQTSYFTTNYEIKYDAYGTLSVQNSGFVTNTIRVKTVFNEIDSLPLADNTYRLTFGRQEFYYWYKASSSGHLFWTSKYNGTRVTFSADGDTLQVAQLNPLFVLEVANQFSVNTNEANSGSPNLFAINGNPATDWLDLQLLNADDAFVTISITDAFGRIVHELQKPPSGQSSLKIPVADYPQGYYWVNVVSEKGSRTLTWLKQ